MDYLYLAGLATSIPRVVLIGFTIYYYYRRRTVDGLLMLIGEAGGFLFGGLIPLIFNSLPVSESNVHIVITYPSMLCQFVSLIGLIILLKRLGEKTKDPVPAIDLLDKE